MPTGPVDPAALQRVAQVARPGAPAAPGGVRETGFRDLIAKYLEDVNALQTEADRAVAGLATGKLDNLHQVIVAVNEADLSFRLMMQVRNRLLEAYKEIMRMQV